MEAQALLGLLPLALLALGGLLLWRRLEGGLVALPPGSTLTHGWALAAAAWLGSNLASVAVLVALGWQEGTELPLALLMGVRAATMSAAVVALLALVAWRHGTLAPLGLAPRAGPPAVLLGLAAWLMVFPAVLAVGWFNRWLLEVLGLEAGLQEALLRFLEEPEARRSVMGWLSMAVVLPVCEEVLFRGGLHGSLRRVLPVPAAILVSGGLFGLAHDAQAALPAAALGVALGWLYERSGRLSVPIAFHVLHNGLTLAMVAGIPELAQP